MLEIISAKYVKDFKVYVELSNGTKGAVDLESSLWGPMFEPLKTHKAFRNFTISETLHTLTWDNGADFAPEHILDKLVEQNAATGAVKPRR